MKYADTKFHVLNKICFNLTHSTQNNATTNLSVIKQSRRLRDVWKLQPTDKFLSLASCASGVATSKATTQTTSFEMSLSKHFDNWAAAAEGYNNVCWELTARHMTDCPTVAVIQSVMEWSPGVRGTQSRQGHPPSKRSFPCFTTLHLHLCKDVTYHCSCPYKDSLRNLPLCVSVYSYIYQLFHISMNPWISKEGITIFIQYMKMLLSPCLPWMHRGEWT